jgi:hypothetical protein
MTNRVTAGKRQLEARPHPVLGRSTVCLVSALLAAAALAVPANASSEPPPRLTSPSTVRPAQLAAPVSAVLTEAEHEFSTMTATRYQHHNVENAVPGTYFYDCVGFVTYALDQAAPAAHSTIMTRFSVRPGRVPSPGLFVQLFGQLNGTQAGWAPVHRVADLLLGDVVAWSYDNAASSNEPGHDHMSRGHAFIVAAAPQPDGTNSYLVQVWDSTATPHGPNDTRRTNPKNLPGPNGKPSGLGTGTVRLDANADGALANVHWSPTSGTVPDAHLAMGRPTA